MDDRDGCQWVLLQHGSPEGVSRQSVCNALGAESVNELMLRKGYARHSAMVIGFQEAMLKAEKHAKDNRIGIWNSQRELFRNATSTMSKAADREGRPVAVY